MGLLDAFLVGIEHKRDVLCDPERNESFANASIPVADNRRLQAAFLQATKRLHGTFQRHPPQVRARVLEVHGAEDGRHGTLGNASGLQQGLEIPEHPAGIGALHRPDLLGSSVDGVTSGGFTSQERVFAYDGTEVARGAAHVGVVDANECPTSVKEQSFEILGIQVTAPIAHGPQVWQFADVRILVTGAAGFVGGHLVPRLEEEGHEVTRSDRDMDVADPGAVEPRLAEIRPDAIIHLAAQSSVAVSWQEPEQTYRVNYLGTRILLDAVRRLLPNTRMLLVSSADVYGSSPPGARPFTEDSPLRPRSPYARSKAAADLLGGTYAARGLDVVRVRPFNHTGPGQTDVFVLSSFARQVASIEAGRAEPLLQVGNLASVRDFLDIEDVVEAYVRLLDPSVPPDVYNVASGIAVRIEDALRSLCELAGIDPSIEVNRAFFRPTDFAVGDAKRLHAAAGWEPRVPFRETLAGLLDEWRSRIRPA